MTRRSKGRPPPLPRPVWVVLVTDAVSALGTGMTVPFLLVYLHDVRGLDVGVAALVVSAIPLASFAGNLLGGGLADRIGARGALVIGLTAGCAGAASMALVHAGTTAFAAALLVGLGASIAWPAQDALLAALVDGDLRGRAFGVRNATLNAGLGLGTLIAGAVVDIGRPVTFELIYLLDALTFAAVIPVLLWTRSLRVRARDDEPASPGGYLSVFRDRAFARVWGLMALLVLVGHANLVITLPALITGPADLPAWAVSVVFAANTAAIVALQPLVLRVVRGRRRTSLVQLVGCAWAVTWLGVLGATLIGGRGSLPVFAAAGVAFAIGETLLAPTMPAMVNDLASDRLRGRYNGAFVLAFTTGFFVGPLTAGPALEAGRQEALLVLLAAGSLVAAAGAARLARHLPPATNVA